MTDYKALAERIEAHAAMGWHGSVLADLRAAAQLARERTEAPEPFGWVGSDGIRQNPDVQVIGPESTHWAVPLYLHPAPQPQPCTDPACPCQDGDPCHYVDHGKTKAMPQPQPERQPVSEPTEAQIEAAIVEMLPLSNERVNPEFLRSLVKRALRAALAARETK